MKTQHWIDRVTAPVAPRWTLKRQRARVAAEVLQRHFEGAAEGRRTQGWHRSSTDANAAIGPGLARLRDAARDLVRNNPHAESAVSTICDHTVGWGIVAKPKPANTRTLDTWNAWANTTVCDADGRHDFYGLQKLVLRTVIESGEVLVRRRFRQPEDGFELPIQLQVLEPDFLDTAKNSTFSTPAGVVVSRIVQGVEFNAIGRCVAYWLFQDHPGSDSGRLGASVRISAENIRHIFKSTRPGQVRAQSWFSPVLLRFKDFDEFEDATLMKQKIAACLAVLTSDVDGTAAPLGTVDPGHADWDSLEPGAIRQMAAGQTVTVVDPPQARDYDSYSQNVLRAIATGLGVTYEDLTGDYTEMPFSAARMSRIRHQARVEDWRWRLMIPQFCDPVWGWVMQVAAIWGKAGMTLGSSLPVAEWSAPPMPMIDPTAEGLAYQRNVRSGIMTLSEAIRERGYDPDTLLREMASDNKKLDDLGLVLDSDPRKMTQAGQLQGMAATAPTTPPTAAPDDVDEEDEDRASARRLKAVRLR